VSLNNGICRPYRPETKGKTESTVRFVKQNFWPGISFGSLADLNQQAHAWMEKVNHQVHSTTREVPYQRLPKERLLLLDEQPDYVVSQSTITLEHSRRWFLCKTRHPQSRRPAGPRATIVPTLILARATGYG
jgi:hypothetical protein